MSKIVQVENNSTVSGMKVSDGDILICKAGFSYIFDEEATLTRLKDGKIITDYKLIEFKNMGKIDHVICKD